MIATSTFWYRSGCTECTVTACNGDCYQSQMTPHGQYTCGSTPHSGRRTRNPLTRLDRVQEAKADAVAKTAAANKLALYQLWRQSMRCPARPPHLVIHKRVHRASPKGCL